jgi:hypothetical protein
VVVYAYRHGCRRGVGRVRARPCPWPWRVRGVAIGAGVAWVRPVVPWVVRARRQFAPCPWCGRGVRHQDVKRPYGVNRRAVGVSWEMGGVTILVSCR